MYAFYFVRYHSGQTPGRYSGPVRIHEHTFLCTQQGGERHTRGCLRGGPAVARFGPLLFLPGCSGGFLGRRIQGDLGLGFLGASGRVSVVPSVSALYLADPQEVGLRGGWRWFSCLLSRRMSGATGSRGRTGAFREEVSHHLR